jgi:hypothetical protein
MAMKEEILKFFKTDRSFNGATALIMKYSNKISLKKQLNVQSESVHLKGVIFEELREIADISHQVYAGIMQSKVVKTVIEPETVVTDPEPVTGPVVKVAEPEKKKDPKNPRKK